MDLPIFHLDWLNNRFLIGIIAVLHVFINHPLAVGGIAFVSTLEWWGRRTGDARWDKLAYRIMTTFFVITTTIGAMTGVGIWFSAGLVNPIAIGSLIRVFYWGWFTEWIVFVTEVVLILIYYLTWKSWTAQGDAKKRSHIRLGFGLAAASWLTMVLIVAILGFMMDTGTWLRDKSFFSAFLNPAYLPQLSFRTPVAMMMAGGAGLFLVVFFTRGDREFRMKAVRAIALWQLCWSPFAFLGATWYANIIPSTMIANLSVANTTQHFAEWFSIVKQLVLYVTLGGMVLAAWAVIRPQWYPRAMYFVPFIGFLFLLGHFERVREFIRKPFAIGNYLYSNGIRAQDYPLLQKEGMLKHLTYISAREITPENQVRVGKELFMAACSRCHTINGINNISSNLEAMYGKSKTWETDVVANYFVAMHKTRTFMPPFPGNDDERKAIASYLVWLQTNRDEAEPAQSSGVTIPKTEQQPGMAQQR
ncbi:MAG: cytochrome c [Ignavibacteria bacterium]|nr:cytochrome c [Ignavibacteria bacterium]